MLQGGSCEKLRQFDSRMCCMAAAMGSPGRERNSKRWRFQKASALLSLLLRLFSIVCHFSFLFLIALGVPAENVQM